MTLPLLKPQRVVPGDSVGIIAPASPPSRPQTVDEAIASLKNLGFCPVLARSVRRRMGYLAGTDLDRASDIMDMFTNPTIKAIFCLRGGYGSARLLDQLDYDAIRNNPKPLIGFSDITSLLIAIYVKSGLITYHGPNLDKAFIDNSRHTFSVSSALTTLTGETKSVNVFKGHTNKIDSINAGKVTAPIIGGNLTILSTLIGTPYQPDFSGKIFFIEDIKEPPYKIDRYLTFFRNAGILKEVSGIIVGQFKDCDIPETREKASGELDLKDVLADRLSNLDIPVISGAPIGHVDDNATIPMGIMAHFNAELKSLEFTESTTSHS